MIIIYFLIFTILVLSCYSFSSFLRWIIDFQIFFNVHIWDNGFPFRCHFNSIHNFPFTLFTLLLSSKCFLIFIEVSSLNHGLFKGALFPKIWKFSSCFLVTNFYFSSFVVKEHSSSIIWNLLRLFTAKHVLILVKFSCAHKDNVYSLLIGRDILSIYLFIY